MRHAFCALLVAGAFLSTAVYGQVPTKVTDASRIYQTISAASLSERHVIFRNLTPELKSALWTIHLSQFLNDPRLSQSQRQLVQAAIELLGPRAYENVAPELDDISESISRLEQSIHSLFSPDLAANVFATLGPAAKSETSSAPVIPRTFSSIGTGRRVIAPLGAVPDCTCSRVSDFCSFWTFGDTTCIGGPCYPVDGCGFGWRYRCTSTCVDPNQ
jgi:hypothetical protein